MTNYAEFNSTNLIWKHFLKGADETALCKVITCKKILKIAGGSTKGLHTHLLSIHKIKLTSQESSLSTTPSTSKELLEPKNKKPKITSYFPTTSKKDECLPEVFARMAAKDGISFNTICNSSDIRAGLVARGFKNVPKSRNTIRKMVLDYYEQVKKLVIKEIIDQISRGFKFSLTLDEWTSFGNCRYMNVNVHELKSYWNLGLIRILGSMPAEKCVSLLNERLNNFKIKLEDDIIGITTDGASVMKKLGKIIESDQQLCFAHALQLAVISVLYKNDPNYLEIDEILDDEHTTFASLENHSDEEKDNDCINDYASEEEDCIQDSNNSFLFNETSEVTIKHQVFGPVITKVRKIVKIFKRSPTKNENYLQKYVKIEFGKVIHLIMDCKTRWSSLLLMLERFDKLKYCVKKAFLDLELDSKIDDSIKMDENEYKIVSDLVALLTPVKATVEALCRRDATLITADIALEFMLTKIKQQKSEIGNKLYAALSHRIKERRTPLSSLVYYLHNGQVTSTKITDVFVPNTSNQNKKIIVSMIKRFHPADIASAADSSCDVQLNQVLRSDEGDKKVKTISEQLNEVMEKGLIAIRTTPIRVESITSKIEKEMFLFESGGTRGDHLQKVYNYILSIRPTSVESERAFSAAGFLCSKNRTRLNDEMMDALSFLRWSFQNEL